MTRDEALKVARKGRRIKHKAFPNQVFRIDADETMWVNTLNQKEEIVCSRHLHCAIFDEGWDVVKEKVEKTFWYAACFNPLVLIKKLFGE